MSSEKRERFGRYLILDHLVDGGMAKICRARFLGEQADKIVAIKMVQPQYSADEAFKTMFMDEIKVTFGLLHPNIIQTYDYGVHKGQLFVAMEYCDGRNLKEYLEKLKERKFVFPIEVSTYIVAQMCQGLYYAHTFRDKLTGQETNIVHRDISPHNVMLTYDGSVKVIDFGIAKSQTNSEATQAGTIKGKLSYLAPEYLEGLELDGRYDQFAVGITLWEMLCMRKLFQEKNDLAVLKKIQECKVPPPSSINPRVPKELDEIVLKALSKDRNNRYEDLDKMNRALMKLLYAKYPDFNSTDVAYFAQELFKEDIMKDREMLFEFGKIDIKPFLDDLKRELEGGTSAPAAAQEPEVQGPKKSQVLDFGFEDEIKEEKKTRSRSKPVVTKKSGVSQNVREKTSVNIANPEEEKVKKLREQNSTIIANIKKIDKPATSSKEKVEKNSTNTSIKKIDKSKLKQNSPIKKIAMLGALLLGVGAYLYTSTSEQEVVVAPKDEKPKVSLKESIDKFKELREPASGKGRIIFTHFDKQQMRVFINNEIADVDPIHGVAVPLTQELIIRVQAEGKKHFVKKIQVDNTAAIEIEIPEMPNVPYAYLMTSSDCITGELKFDLWEENRKINIPIQDPVGIPIPLLIDDNGRAKPQTYQMLFRKKGEEVEKKLDVTVSREDQTIDLCEKL